MPLLNYTTGVAVDRTAEAMRKMLAKAGAERITYSHAKVDTPGGDQKGDIIGLEFSLDTPYGVQEVRLPVDAAAVRKVLLRQKVDNKHRTHAHAQKVAWRIVKDWLEAQLALAQTRMVTLDQIMLPYIRTDDGKTVYQRFISSQLALEGR